MPTDTFFTTDGEELCNSQDGGVCEAGRRRGGGVGWEETSNGVEVLRKGGRSGAEGDRVWWRGKKDVVERKKVWLRVQGLVENEEDVVEDKMQWKVKGNSEERSVLEGKSDGVEVRVIAGGGGDKK